MKTFQLLTSGLLAAMLLTGCGGGGGGDSTGVSACSNFSGTWLAMSGSYTIQSCSGTKKDVTGASLTITQQGCTVSWQQPDWDGTIQNWSGIAQGKVLHIVNNLVDHSGITTTETLDVNINDGILTGDSSWKYGNGACSGLGQSHYTATRLTTPTVTTTTVTTSPATQFPIGSAMSAFFQASHSYTLTATNGANTYTIQTSYTPGAASVFEGQQASTYTQSGSVSVNGVVTGGVSSGVSYISLSPYKNLGYIGSDGRYQVYANQQISPTYATVGQSVALDTSITYTNNTKAVVYANGTDTWSLLSDTSTTAWACNNESYTVVGSSPNVITNCFKIDTSGNVLALKVIMQINGTTLTFL
jgi:hypothetical protein